MEYPLPSHFHIYFQSDVDNIMASQLFFAQKGMLENFEQNLVFRFSVFEDYF